MRDLLYRVRKLAVRLATFANMIGTAVLFFLVAIMNVDVVARGIFHAPFRGVVEVVIFSLVLIVFLQLPNVVHGDRLTRSDGFLSYAGSSNPRLANFVRRTIDAIACIFMAMITWAMWPEFLEAFESCHFFSQPEFGPAPTGNFFVDFGDAMARCDYFGTPGIFTAPWWPAKLAILFGVALSSVLFAFKAFLGNEPAPAQDEGSTA